jgi:hypothetical protein
VLGALLVLAGAALGHPARAQEATPWAQDALDRIARDTAALRELPPPAHLDDVLISRDELAAMLPSLLAEDVDPAETAAETRAYAALGLLPEGTDLFALDVNLMGEQAVGLYDPVTDTMYVVATGHPAIEEYSYAHEFTHALQDADLDPHDLLEDLSALNGDQVLAALALSEGDATATSNAYLEQHPALALALAREVSGDFPELEQAPAAISVALLFPYVSGADFVERLRADGGWDAVDAAYADVPASTEQILHPRKYLDRDAPTTVFLPDPVTALGAGWHSVNEDTLGEMQTALLLADLAPGQGFNETTGRIDLPEAARNAAAGWDGDRYVLWEDGSGTSDVLVWRSVWDTPEDARAFSRALARFEEQRWSGAFSGESPDDIALVTPDIAARILLDGQEVRYVEAPDLTLADAAMTALRDATQPTPAPGPN